jgi:uncharacterized membrane protein YfcA
VLGIGLPATAMALLTWRMAPTVAISVVAIPIIATNLLQFFSMPKRLETARSLGWVAASLTISIFVTASLVTRFPESFLVIAIGAVMMFFSLHALLGFRLPIGDSVGWQLGTGIASGICGGLSSIWAPPVVMYLLARNVDKDAFVSGTGFLFMVGSVPLAAGLVLAGVLDGETLALSLLCTVVALAAFRLGAALRRRLASETFRRLVLGAFLVMGLRLVISGLG